MVGAGGFGPPKRNATDLQSAPFGHSGTPPYSIGAGGRTRTPDLLITNQLLYQLSYTSLFCMVGATGLEPAASWSQTMHSTKLSYAPIVDCHLTAFILYTTKKNLSIPFFNVFQLFSLRLSGAEKLVRI